MSNKTMSYINEYQTALESIGAGTPGIRSLGYFKSTAARWHADFVEVAGNPECPSIATRPGSATYPHNATKRIVILGHGIPEQFVHACGMAPHYILGGSHASCQWSDDLVPRDADPTSRSILGYALKLAERTDLDPLFVVPLANDNMRKIAFLLNTEGHKVHVVDIPPHATSASSQLAWEHDAIELLKAIQHHVGGRVTARSVREADKLVGAARAAMVEFENACDACYGVLDDPTRLFVLGTYYQTNTLAHWTTVLRRLTEEVRARHRTIGRPTTSAPRILVIGSPMLFPQYKVPSLVQDAGMRLLATADAASTARYASLSEREREVSRGGTIRIVRAIARKHVSLDASSAHVINHAMEQYVRFLMSTKNIDGVVCHVLKGQIEHDFLLARLEPLFEQHDIPVFRLETDYQYQDVEQLRIRLEAFAEMLRQRTLVASHAPARRHCA